MTSPIVHRPTVSRICAGCDGPMVVTFDAVGRASKKGPQCPRCDRVSIAQQGSIPELRGWSQQESAPPVPPLTLPKHRSAFAVLPTVHPFVEVPARPDPLPSRYVKSEAETHPKDLPADHPRRITYRAKLSATQKAARARKREEREAREALVRPAESLPARTKTERKYQPKPCAFLPCGKLFTPTGPRSEYCEACR